VRDNRQTVLAGGSSADHGARSGGGQSAIRPGDVAGGGETNRSELS
jgi:hypothetical protein